MAYENAKLQFSENFNQSVMAADKTAKKENVAEETVQSAESNY